MPADLGLAVKPSGGDKDVCFVARERCVWLLATCVIAIAIARPADAQQVFGNILER
jgi:hypothetical protein